MSEKVQQLKDLEELIKILTENQRLLDSNKKRIKMRRMIGDLNFSFLSILEKIKENYNIKDQPEKIITSMYR